MRPIDADQFRDLLEKDKRNFPGHSLYNEGVQAGLERARVALSREADTPTVDAGSEGHAHWRYRYNFCDGTIGQAICSNCGNVSFDGCRSYSGIFCSRCGYRMDEEVE